VDEKEARTLIYKALQEALAEVEAEV